MEPLVVHELPLVVGRATYDITKKETSTIWYISTVLYVLFHIFIFSSVKTMR